jgi:hypothetical protein
MSLLFCSRSSKADLSSRQKVQAVLWLTILTFHTGPLSIPLTSGLVPTKPTGCFAKSAPDHQGSSWGCRFERRTTTRRTTTILGDGPLDSVAAIEPNNQKKRATPMVSRSDKTKTKSKQDSSDLKTKNGTTLTAMNRSATTTTKDTTKRSLEQQINEMIQKGKRGGNTTREFVWFAFFRSWIHNARDSPRMERLVAPGSTPIVPVLFCSLIFASFFFASLFGWVRIRRLDETV